MKLRNLCKVMFVFAWAFTFNSCVDDNDYSTPKFDIADPGLTATNTIQQIKDMYKGNTVDFNEVGEDLIIEGYVTSSDEGGNVYKALYIQDKPENPEAAIQIVLDAQDTYSFYNVGRKVFVKLNGLGLSDYKGMLQLGELDGTKVNRISSTSYEEHIIRSSETATIVPLEVTVEEAKNDNNLGKLIKLTDMHAQTENETYANIDNTYSVSRTFENCDGETIIMRNSGYAAFKSQTIPNKRGSITAILAKYNKDYQLFIRTTKDVNFIQPYSCDGDSGEPEPYAQVVKKEINETFDGVSKDKDVALEGWFVAKPKGERNWVGAEFDGNKFIKASGYKAKGSEIESWIVTPGLDLSTAKNKNFSFETNRGFSKGEEFEVLISSDFKGDVETAKWEKLDATIAPASSKYGEFVNSGDIDLSKFNGIVNIAFRYIGNNTDKTGTFQLDNVKFNYEASGNGNPDPNPNPDPDPNPTPSGNELFAGASFDDWNSFLATLNKHGLKNYATQSSEGKTGSALQIKGTPAGNDYVFAVKVPANFNPSGKTKITMYVKGNVSGKSLSFNVYETAKDYFRFNAGEITTSDVVLEPKPSNQYAGSINTAGKWVKLTLDISNAKLNTVEGEKLFALKVGKGVAWDILVDDIMIE